MAEEKTSAKDRGERPHVAPPIEVIEGPDQYRVLVDVPGADQNTVEVTWQEGTLRIRADVEPLEPEGFQLVSAEFEPGNYERALSLPEDVDVDRIEATVRDGVLTVVLPRRKQSVSRRIAVEAG